jgi:hypothetical protein
MPVAGLIARDSNWSMVYQSPILHSCAALPHGGFDYRQGEFGHVGGSVLDVRAEEAQIADSLADGSRLASALADEPGDWYVLTR